MGKSRSGKSTTIPTASEIVLMVTVLRKSP